MKTNKLFLIGVIILALATNLSFTGIHASVSYEGASSYVETNVALNNANWTFQDLAGNPVTYASFVGDELTPACLTNGSNNPFNGTLYLSNGTGVIGWAVLDLGKTETITKLVTSFWHDHSYVDVIVQVAQNAAFTEGLVTLFNNDTNNSVGEGIGGNIAYQDISGSYQTLEFVPVSGRYLRVTNVDTERGYTILNEIQVIAATSGIIPLTANRGFRYVENNFDLVLSTQYENASIYYTTDGSYPTLGSALYISPIDTSSFGSKFVIRAIEVLADQTISLPVTMKYELIQKNVCLAKPASFTKATAAFTGTASAAMVTDGAFSPYNVWGSLEGDANLCFAMVDFGEEYSIEKVVVKLFHDWGFADVVIQLATDAEFTENVYTVYNNDWDHSVISDATTANATTTYYFESPAEGHTFEFAPVRARYIRVYDMSVQNASRYSVWEEIQAYNYVDPAAAYPIMPEAIQSAPDIADFTVGYGLILSDLLADARLPQSLEVVDFAGESATAEGNWVCDSYNPAVAGVYSFHFETASDSIYVDSYSILQCAVTVAAPVDRSALLAKLTAANALVEVDYTSTSWPDFAAVKTASQTLYDQTVVLQAEIDQSCVALQNAIATLEARGNKTALNTLITTIQGLSSSGYTAASWNALQAKLVEAQSVQSNADAIQSTVDLAYADLDAIYELLAPVGDKTALQARYNELVDVQNIYTAASWLSFEDALETALIILNKTEPTVSETDVALAGLNLKYGQLVEKADFSALQTLVDSFGSMDLSGYTNATRAVLAAELVQANAVLSDDETAQDVINTAVTALNQAQNGLLIKGDKTALLNLVNAALKSESAYTATTYAAYYLAYEQALAVSEDPEAVQTAVDLVAGNFTSAIAALVSIADKTELNALIEEANALVQDDYTLVSFEALQIALEAAEAVSESNNVDQTAADEAKTVLQVAIDHLEAPEADSIFSCRSNSIWYSIELIGFILVAFSFFIYKRK